MDYSKKKVDVYVDICGVGQGEKIRTTASWFLDPKCRG